MFVRAPPNTVGFALLRALRSVTPDRLWVPLLIAKIRMWVALLPSMMVEPAPAPLMVTDWLTLRGEATVMVMAGTLMTSAPASAFASWMAARRVQTLPAVAQTPLP